MVVIVVASNPLLARSAFNHDNCCGLYWACFFSPLFQLSYCLARNDLGEFQFCFSKHDSSKHSQGCFYCFQMSVCYKVIQRFRVTGLFAGQHNTKLHGTITGVIYVTERSRSWFKDVRLREDYKIRSCSALSYF